MTAAHWLTLLVVTSCAAAGGGAPRPAPPPLPLPATLAPASTSAAEPTSQPQPAAVQAEAVAHSEPMSEDTYTTVELSSDQQRQVVVRFDRAACDSGDGSDLEIVISQAGQELDRHHFTTDAVASICSEHSRRVELGDFNFDGHEDLAIPFDQSGPYGSTTFAILLFQPLDGHYREAPLLSELTRESMGLFGVDTQRRRLTTSGKSGCCIHYQEDFAVGGDYPQSIGAETVTFSFENDRCYVLTERSGTRGNGAHKRACRKDEL